MHDHDILGGLVVVGDAQVVIELVVVENLSRRSGAASFCTPTLRQRIPSHASLDLYSQTCKSICTASNYLIAFVGTQGTRCDK